jgi:hypothetical protein
MTVSLPDLVRIRQRFPTHPTVDVAAALTDHWQSLDVSTSIGAGARVAIAAGSRGVRDAVPALQTLVTLVRQAGGSPFIVPAMGSHGGATAAGQRDVLAALGVGEETVGAPVVSSMDVVTAGTSRFGAPVWVARDLAEADAVIVLNRVKPHTDFQGPIESGLVKMLVIGAGKHRGAAEAHRLALRHGFPAVLEEHARLILSHLRLLCGVALIEEQHERTAEVHLLPASGIVVREPALLERARALTPTIPFSAFDCLLVDEMGKEISGTGMDTKVIGRLDTDGETAGPPRITRIVVRDLTAASHGNAIGIGAADFTTTRLLAAVDRRATAINCITSTAPESGRLPIAFERDVDAVLAASATCGAASPEDLSLVWIRSTLHLEELMISTALLEQAGADPGLEIVGEPFPFPAGDDGSLAPVWHRERDD